MNNQEFFSKTVLHLRKQGEKSVLRDKYGKPKKFADGSLKCAYRDGTKSCAVGCHILDTVYAEHMETRSYSSLRYAPAVGAIFKGVDDNLIANMQNLHDSKDPDQWEAEFSIIAETYGLTVP